MSKNYIFRELECQMTKEEVAELCFKSVRTVTGWDEGKPIPPECKRLMTFALGDVETLRFIDLHLHVLKGATGRVKGV